MITTHGRRFMREKWASDRDLILMPALTMLARYS